mmetsp:Transcript_138115/g.240214  ORF Transcript_138115/g.240214 Transcript_138115/m.240214 type:complete len:187 (-) Transcript_138115:41-601(-)
MQHISSKQLKGARSAAWPKLVDSMPALPAGFRPPPGLEEIIPVIPGYMVTDSATAAMQSPFSWADIVRGENSSEVEGTTSELPARKITTSTASASDDDETRASSTHWEDSDDDTKASDGDAQSQKMDAEATPFVPNMCTPLRSCLRSNAPVFIPTDLGIAHSAVPPPPPGLRTALSAKARAFVPAW